MGLFAWDDAHFAATQLLVVAAVDWFWGDSNNLRPVRVLISLGCGLVLGIVSWWSGEARYQNYLLDEKFRSKFRS